MASFGLRLGLVDYPNERSSHRIPTPKGGGIGILAAFMLSSIWLGMPWCFWLPATLLALLSLVADKIELSPKFRLTFHLLGALILVGGIHGFSASPIHLVALLFLSVFLAGTANFYNFMDGINGIAAITGIVAFGLLALYGYQAGLHYALMVQNICIALACAGFLPFNTPQARTFMGDVGSILLGFVFAASVVSLSADVVDFFCLCGLLFPFYADEIVTMISRLKDGDDLGLPHRKHLYQLLANEHGIAHWKISLGYGLLQLFVGISVLTVKYFNGLAAIFLIGVYFTLFIRVCSSFRQ